jgi:hypothetical protein
VASPLAGVRKRYLTSLRLGQTKYIILVLVLFVSAHIAQFQFDFDSTLYMAAIMFQLLHLPYICDFMCTRKGFN